MSGVALRRGSKLGKYRLDRRIGKGAYAAVWRARDTVEKRLVALKVAFPELVQEHGRGSLEHEARIASRLSHPNIVAVRNADWIDGYFVIASDLAERNLTDYPGARRSALATLQTSLHLFLRLFAPFLPYVTEEVWSWRFAGSGRDASVHTAAWPQSDELSEIPAPDCEGQLECAIEVLGKIRRTKTDAQKPLRWPIGRLDIRGSQSDRRALEAVLVDVLAAGAVDASVCTIEPGQPHGDGPCRDPGGQAVGLALARHQDEIGPVDQLGQLHRLRRLQPVEQREQPFCGD